MGINAMSRKPIKTEGDKLKAPAAGEAPHPDKGNGETLMEENLVQPLSEPLAADKKYAEPKPPTVEELTDHLQRLAAEFENYKKRAARDLEGIKLVGMAQVVETLLPALDSFERSLTAPANVPESLIWREGLAKIHQQLVNVLEKLGLKTVKPEAGEPLNPNLHEVLFATPTDQAEPNSIIATLQVGYQLGERLLRPAKVQVAVRPPETTSEQQEGKE